MVTGIQSYAGRAAVASHTVSQPLLIFGGRALQLKALDLERDPLQTQQDSGREIERQEITQHQMASELLIPRDALGVVEEVRGGFFGGLRRLVLRGRLREGMRKNLAEVARKLESSCAESSGTPPQQAQ